MSTSQHWYTKDGKPNHFVPNDSKPGELRPANLKDAKKLGLFPSSTGIERLLAAPALTDWLCLQWALAARDAPPIEDQEEWEAFVAQKAGEVSKGAADDGTKIHAAIQACLEGKPYPEVYKPHVDNAKAVVEASTGYATSVFTSERSFTSTHYGYGGQVDLSGPWGVIDFKSTDKDLAKVKTWPSHARQIASYKKGLGNPGKGAIVYVHRQTGLARFMELDEADLVWGWETFEALLATWRAVNRYDPRIQT